MNKSINFLIMLFAMVYVAFHMLQVFSSSAPGNGTHATANPYVNALGQEVSLADYHGDYLWVDYAAEWCSYCESQTKTLNSLEEQYGDRLTFLTVVTGTDRVTERPSAETAMKWARRFGLDKNKVLARFSTSELPYHILYSPSGTILFEGSGLFNASKIRHVLSSHTELFP